MEDDQERIDVAEEDTHLNLPNGLLSYKQVAYTMFEYGGLSFVSRIVETIGSFVGILFLSRVNEDTLAASSLITALQRFTLTTSRMSLFGIGLLTSKSRGMNQKDEIKRFYQYGILSSIVLSGICISLLMFSEDILKGLKQPDISAEITQDYFKAYVFAIPAILMQAVNQEIILGMEEAGISLLVNIVQCALLISSSYCMVLGNGGSEAYNQAGLGYAYTISSWITFLSTLAIMALYKPIKELALYKPNLTQGLSILKEIGSYAYPMALQIGSELLALTAGVQLVGLLGKEPLAATEVAIQYVYFLALPAFVMSKSCGNLVAKAIGENNVTNAKRYGHTGIAMSLLIPFIGLIAFTTAPKFFISAFLSNEDNNNAIITTAKNLLLINVLGQIADSIRNVSSGALRGFGDKKVPSVVGVVTMLLSVPAAYPIAFNLNLKAEGVFITRDVFMLIGAAILLYRWIRLKEVQPNANNIQSSELVEVTTKEASSSSSWVQSCCPFSFFRSSKNNAKLGGGANERTGLLAGEDNGNSQYGTNTVRP